MPIMRGVRALGIAVTVVVVLLEGVPVRPASAGDCDALDGQTMRLVIPAAPGGGFDTVARTIAPYIARQTGAQVLVDNVSAAGGRVASKQVRDAAPDGRTIGIVSGAALIFADLLGEADDARIDEFHVIGQLDNDPYVMLVAAEGPIDAVDDLWNGSLPRPVLFGSTSLSNALQAVGLIHLLGFPADILQTAGGQEGNLALLRGEVDAVTRSAETARQLAASGDMRPLVTLTDAPVEGSPELASIPHLGGADGLAVARAAVTGMTATDAAGRAALLQAAVGSLRLIVAPRGLPDALGRCLDGLVDGALASTALVAELAAKGRAISPLPAASLQPIRDLARSDSDWLRPLADQARRRAAGG
jgi:tripartite-type tricarboxylate transporter receptor subunit TctC